MELVPKYFDLSCARIEEAVASMKAKKCSVADGGEEHL
jgi:hypothetical protein